jgi:hypothetical protein
MSVAPGSRELPGQSRTSVLVATEIPRPGTAVVAKGLRPVMLAAIGMASLDIVKNVGAGAARGWQQKRIY